MGGIGKTTLAKELYNRKRSSFMSRCSFLFNVKAASSTNSLHKLQKKLLKDLLIQNRPFHTKEEGIVLLAKDLSSMAVLIVLDDVDHVDQIRVLLPSNLGQGSLIIVTTREKNVLTSWRISSIYPMKRLDPFNAKLLFCRHVFSQPYSQLEFENSSEKMHNFEHLIERFVETCNGLPLSLKVLGALVNGQSEAYWEDQLLKFPKILPTDIKETLKVSYDALDGEVRQMFLDVACFFIGETKNLAVQIWYGSRWSGELGWETLVNKCLVELDKEGNIEMHDHLRDLGRQIAGDVSPSRIWKEEQIGTQDGRTPIRGIVAGRRLHSGTSSLAMDTYCALPLDHYMDYLRPSLRALQLVAVKGNDFREEFVASSSGLVWLRLWDFTGTNLPSWLSLKSLRVLQLYNAQNMEELWQDNVQPPLQLRELVIDLTRMTCFQGLPRSIGHLRHLKKIVLNGNGNGMKTLPEEFCHLGSLETLQMSDFSMLSSLPHQFGELKNLRILIFSGVQLTALPDSFKQLRLLKFLDISNSQTFCFTSEMLNVLEFMTKLQTLTISHCPQLVELPHLTTLVSLRELNLSYTGLREIPNNIGQLIKLETLVIGSDNLTSLPGSLGELSNLTSLTVYDCDLLKSLPETVGRLSNLQSLKIEDTPILELDLGMGSACNLSSLKCLSLFNTGVSMIAISACCCPSLEALRLRCNTRLTSISCLPGNFREIIVYGCEKLRSTYISHLLNLENLIITFCPKLEELQIESQRLTILPETFKALPCLTHLTIKSDNFTSFSESLGALSCLTHLTICSGSLKSLPESLGALSCLTDLRICSGSLTSLLESLGALPCLSHLTIESNNLASLPESLGALPCLSHLTIESNNLASLPESLGELSCLTDLRICSGSLTSLLESLGGLPCLSHLTIESSNLASLPESVGGLPCLTDLRICSGSLTSLPESLGALRRLSRLTIETSNLASLPESLGGLPCLTDLRICSGSLTSLPESLGALPRLRHLTIETSNLASLPESLGALSRLTDLRICSGNLTSLPESLGALRRLSRLTIESSNLASLPESLGALRRLSRLTIESSNLASLPESLGALYCWTDLTICSGSLTSLPESLGALSWYMKRRIWNDNLKWVPKSRKAFTHLSISNNNLTSLSESLGALSWLRHLTIQSEDLPSLPDTLGALSCLVSLSIVYCHKWKSLPEAFGRLFNLQSLDIYSTPLVEIGLGIGSPSGCNLNSLKILKLEHTGVRRISISDDCCPSLETLCLCFNYDLTEIETLPGNVRDITVRHCERLKNIRGTGALQNLERLQVDDCPDLEVLSCPSYMHSTGHTICIRGCPKAPITREMLAFGNARFQG